MVGSSLVGVPLLYGRQPHIVRLPSNAWLGTLLLPLCSVYLTLLDIRAHSNGGTCAGLTE